MTTQPFGRIVDLGDWLKQDLQKLTTDEVKALHIKVARELKNDVLATARPQPDVTTIVDGRVGAAEEAVRPFGVIAYRFQYWGEILRAAIEFARSISPVDTGRYKESWFALADGKLITDLDNPPDATEYAITNDQPYSRVIEIGKKGKGKKFRAGVHVADKTTKAMLTRFGNSISARTMFLDLAAGGSGRAETVPWVTRRGARVNYPAVVMRAL